MPRRCWGWLRRGCFVGVLLSLVVNVFLIRVGYYRSSYDAYVHIFFADHYRREWFNLWETKWYGGFSVATYPPLFHQVVALLSFALGVKYAYEVACVFAALLIVYGVYRLTYVLDRRAVFWGSIIAAFMPSVGLFMHSFGQLPMMFSTGLALVAVSLFYEYLVSGGVLRLLASTFLLTSVVICHHLTIVFFGVPLLVVMVLAGVIFNEARLDRMFKGGVILVVASAIISFVVLKPYIEDFRTLTLQAAIPHGTRENIFSNLTFSVMFFWAIYSFTVCLLPNAVVIAYRRRKFLPLFLLFIFHFVIGLGGTTPLPSLVFGEMWKILTYDKFAFWASILYIPFLAVMAENAGVFTARFYENVSPGGEPKFTRYLLIVGLVTALALSYVLASGAAIHLGLRPNDELPEDLLRNLASFLNEYKDYYYITLGFNSQRLRLNIMSSAPSLDGGYNSARLNPLLAKSGVENIDAAKFFPNGLGLLKSILSRASSLGLKHVICADSFYDPILMDYGFTAVEEYDAGGKKIKIWELGGAQKAGLNDKVIVYLPWSVLPLICLAAGLGMVLALNLKEVGVHGKAR